MAAAPGRPDKIKWLPGMDLFGPGVFPTGFDQRGNRVRLQSVGTSGSNTPEDPLICYSWDYNLDKNLKEPERREYLERELKDVCRITKMTCIVLRTNTQSRTVKPIKGPDGENLKIQVSCPSRYTVYLGHHFAGALLEGHIFTRVKYRPGLGWKNEYTVQIDDEDGNDRWNKENLDPIELWVTSKAFHTAPAPPKTHDLNEFPALGTATSTPATSPTKKKTTATPKPTPAKQKKTKTSSAMTSAVASPTANIKTTMVGYPLLSPTASEFTPMLSAHPPLERATRPSPEDRGFRMVPPHADIEQPSNIPQYGGADIPQYDGADERTEEDGGQLQMQRWNQARQDHQMSYIDSFKPPPRSWDNPYTYLVDYPEVFVSVDPVTRYVYHVVEGPEGQPRWFFFDNNTSYEYDPLSRWHRQENEDGTFTWWLTNYVTSDDQLDHGPATWGLYRKSKGPPRFPMWNRRLQQMHNKAKAEVRVEKAQKAQADQEAQAAREAQLALTETEAAEAMDTF